MSQRYVCMHGHFYQPPRENPWTGEIDEQPSAAPYHDWNQRITAECYAPNAAARILNGEGHVVRLIDNYEYISFNFGPTLLSWMAEHEPETYHAILRADAASCRRFSGHGSAIAQAYNHMIMPLANRRDQETQVIWGIRDFRHRFGRDPEGMWLPETAVDLNTLDALARHGIRFTILAPHQVQAVRPPDGGWTRVTAESVDPTIPYLVRLPSGRSITVFVYNGPLSRAVAFEGLLHSGERLAERLLDAFPRGYGGLQGVAVAGRLAHIATDGETYGHHHRYGEMALAYALQLLEPGTDARLTNYGEFLSRYPAVHEARILENTAWSCSHGVERWRSDCGCCSGAHPTWHQRWRAPLRSALDWLRDEVAGIFAAEAASLLRQPWCARNDYIDVLLERSQESLDRFFAMHEARPLNDEERVRALTLLELQRYAMFMYTSCGWFFDDLTGIEAVQILRYAARAAELAEEISGRQVEPAFVRLLDRIPVNRPGFDSGREVFDKLVVPSRLGIPYRL